MYADKQRGKAVKSYRVVWEMDIIASTPQDAAERALLIQRDPESIATCFEVTALGVDLGRGAPTVGETVQVDLTYPDGES